MKTVTVCRSTRFSKFMKRIAFELEIKYALNILQCTYNEDNLNMTDKEYNNLV